MSKKKELLKLIFNNSKKDIDNFQKIEVVAIILFVVLFAWTKLVFISWTPRNWFRKGFLPRTPLTTS